MTATKSPQTSPLEQLDLVLDQIAAQSQDIRERYSAQIASPVESQDLQEVASGGRLVARLLADIDEALKQIYVAGLAYPDPELPDELAALAERSERHGLATATEHLLGLRANLEAIGKERDLAWRQQLSSAAWSRTQRFVAWLRLFRTEHGFLQVQGQLAAQSTGTVERRRVAYPARTMSVWPVGIELSPGGRLVIFARDLDSELVVLLRDQLAEYDPEHPLRSHAISRLFQDSVRLGDVLSSVIRLENHPVVQRHKALLFRPAFQATPKLLPVADNFEAPALTQMPLDESSGVPVPVHSAGPAHLRLHVTREGGVLEIKSSKGGAVPIELDAYALKFNLTKLMLREATETLELDAVVLPRKDALLVLSVTTPLDNTVYPSHDPALFRVGDVVLVRRAETTRAALGKTHPVLGLWLRVAAGILGGNTADELTQLHADVTRITARSLDDHYRLGLAAFILGVPYAPRGLVSMIQQTLSLAALVDKSELDLEELAFVLGQDPSSVSAADLRLINGDAIYKAIWLAMAAEVDQTLLPYMEAVLTTRYSGELRDPTPGDVCARTLLMALSALAADDGFDELPELIEAIEAEADGGGPLRFLMAYVMELRDIEGKARDTPMPEFIELFWYADTVGLLAGTDRLGTPVTMLGINRERLSQSCAEALCRWSADPQRPTRHVSLQAADAMFVLAAAGLRDLMVC